MRNLFKSIILALLTISAMAQIPAPQINLGGNIGCQGFPCLNNGTLQFTGDADRNMTVQETSATGGIKVTSTVPLTATRNLVLPAGNFQFIAVENATTGGQSIQVIGQSGTGVTIANGASATVWFDGTNVVQTGSSTSVTLQTNSVNNSSQTTLNLKSNGQLTVTNTSGGDVQLGGGPFDLQGAAGQAGFTVVVAASDSVNKAFANIVCTGTADQNCINSAIALCPNSQTGVAGCNVTLQNGIYNLTGSVVIDNDDVTLTGTNYCMWGGYIHNWTGTSSPAGAIGTGCAQLLATTTGFDLLQIEHNNPGGTGSDTTRHRGIKIHFLYFVGSNYTQSAISNTNNADDDHMLIDYNVFQRLNYAVKANFDSPDILYNNCQDDLSCIFTSGNYGHIVGNLLYDIGGTAIQCTSEGCIVEGNTIGDCAEGIYLEGNNALAANNVIRNCYQPVWVDHGAESVHIQNNSIYFEQADGSGNTTFAGINVVDGNGDVITGNTGFTFFGQPNYFLTMGTNTNSIVANNDVQGLWNYGLTPFNLISGTNLSSANLAAVPAVGPATVTSGTIASIFDARTITGITSGNPITVWNDSSGNNYTAAPPVGTGNAPLYIASSPINSLPAVLFNGTSQSVTAQITPFSPTVPKTYFAVVSLTSLPSGTVTIDSANSGSLTQTMNVDSTHKLASYGGTYVVSTLPTMTTATTYVVMLVSNGASSRMAQNGTSVAVSNGTNTWQTGVTLGSNAGGTSDFFPGYITAFYAYTGAMNTTDTAAVGAALCATYAVTCGGSW